MCTHRLLGVLCARRPIFLVMYKVNPALGVGAILAALVAVHASVAAVANEQNIFFPPVINVNGTGLPARPLLLLPAVLYR